MNKKTENLGIQPLNDDVLANLSIDELEERLELQLLHVTEAQGCWDCGVQCNQCGINNPPPPPSDGGGGGGGGDDGPPVDQPI